VVLIPTSNLGHNESDLPSTSRISLEQCRAVAMTLQEALNSSEFHSILGRNSNLGAAGSALSPAPYLDPVVSIVYRYCHAAWSALVLHTRVVAAGVLATKPMHEVLPTYVSLQPSLRWVAPSARWCPSSVRFAVHAHSHSLLIGLWHHASLPPADFELMKKLRQSRGGSCPAGTCRRLLVTAGTRNCVSLCGERPFVPRFTVPSSPAPFGSIACNATVNCMGDTDPIVASLMIRSLRDAQRRTSPSSDSSALQQIGMSGPVLVLDEWGGAVSVEVYDPGTPFGMVLHEAVLSLQGFVGPSEFASTVRRVAIAGNSMLRTGFDSYERPRGTDDLARSGVHIRSTGQLVVKRDASGRVKLEKPAVPENMRHRGREATQRLAVEGDRVTGFTALASDLSQNSAVIPLVPDGDMQSSVDIFSTLESASAAFSGQVGVPSRSAVAFARAASSASPFSPMTSFTHLDAVESVGPVARLVLPSGKPPPPEVLSSFDPSAVTDVSQASGTEPLEIAIIRVFSPLVLGSIETSRSAASQHHDSVDPVLAEAESDGLLDVRASEAWEEGTSAAYNALQYTPSAPAYWPDNKQRVSVASSEVHAKPSDSSLLGCICVGVLATVKVPSSAQTALEVTNSSEGERVVINAVLRPLASAKPLIMSSDASESLLTVWQRLAVHRAHALMRMAAAVISARPDLKSAIPQGLRLSPLSPSVANFCPSLDHKSDVVREDHALVLSIDLPAVSESTGCLTSLSIWLDPVNGSIQLALSRHSSFAAPPSSDDAAPAMPLCSVLLECAHFAQDRMTSRVSQVRSTGPCCACTSILRGYTLVFHHVPCRLLQPLQLLTATLEPHCVPACNS
jgi:hypothetical protein